MLKVAFVALLVLCMTSSCYAQSVDATLQPESKGSDVVNSVVDLIKSRCIFSEDRQFLRRLAFIETNDGNAISTYRKGYNGGIWNVNQTMFDATKNCPLVVRYTCDIIKQSFNIDWTSVTWMDLRKPLYSGLAAAMFLMTQTGSNSTKIPSDLPGQETFYDRYYHFGQAAHNFVNTAADASRLTCDKDIDLLFILDSSGSIDDSDFQLALNFVAKVLDAKELDVPNRVRVSTMYFADSPYIDFSFNSFANKSQIVHAVKTLTRTTGGTYTSLAIDLARTKAFTTVNGARPRSKTTRVAVLVTDGESDSLESTRLAADRLKEETGVTVFSVGVGSFFRPELDAIASTPTCSHVQTLQNFSDIDSLISEIQRMTCQAYTTLTVGNTVSVSTRDNQTSTTAKLSPSKNDTVPNTLKVNVSCGIAEIYVSHTNANPNPALYEGKYTAQAGHPIYLTTKENTAEGRPLYITVIGTKLPTSASGLNNCSDYIKYDIVPEQKHWEVKCCLGERCQECEPEWLRQDHHVYETVCTKGPEEFHNPCIHEAVTTGTVIFPYPYDVQKFIRCDYKGNAYVTYCPNRQTFNPATSTCGYQSPGTMVQVPLPGNYPNPCTPAHIEAQYFYFAYEPDRRMFIHCDLFGDAWLQQCPVEEVWSVAKETCVSDLPNVAIPTTPAPQAPNPCTPENLAASKLFFPYPCDTSRFIHCDMTGRDYVQFCPATTHYDPATYICMPGKAPASLTSHCRD